MNVLQKTWLLYDFRTFFYYFRNIRKSGHNKMCLKNNRCWAFVHARYTMASTPLNVLHTFANFRSLKFLQFWLKYKIFNLHQDICHLQYSPDEPSSWNATIRWIATNKNKTSTKYFNENIVIANILISKYLKVWQYFQFK